MKYLTEADEIQAQIAIFALSKTLWLDTEIADWNTPLPRLSLIQVLSEPTDLTGNSAYIIDVLDKPNLAVDFINQVIVNPQIEKVFHNADFDLKYLGGKLAPNVTCTLKLARKIKREVLQVTNLQLKTLAVELCGFSNVDKEEQGSDWGQRPLSQKQLHYAAMDTVYLAAVHQRLLEISKSSTTSSTFDMGSHASKGSTGQSKNKSLTATNIRVAFECPRLFFLNQRFGGNTLFLPPDSAVGIGTLFHQLADEFVTWIVREPRCQGLLKPVAKQLQAEELASQIQQIFYEQKFFFYLEKVSQKENGQAQALLKVWQALRGLIRHFAELLVTNRGYCTAETVIHNTFVSEERNLESYFHLPDGTQQRVAGKFDCLVFNFNKNRLCVVEFKTYQPADPSAQLAQVALYSYILWERKKIGVDAAVYCVVPELKEYQYSWEELENTVHQLIPYKLQQMRQWLIWEPPLPNPPPIATQPHLCEICPQQQKCQSYFDVTSKAEKSSNTQPQQTTAKQDKPVKVNADVLGEKLVSTLQSFGIGVDYQGAAVGPAFIRVKLKPYPGVKVNALLKLSADLQVQLELANPPLISPQAGYVSVDLPRPDRQTAKFEDYIKTQVLPPTAPVKISIGVDLEGQLLEADLSDPNTCHFLVGGTTGSGKSEFLRSLLLSLIVRHSPEHLQIALVDPKRVTFPEFEEMRWLHSPVVKDSERAIELMDELVVEMESRYQRFEKAGCADLKTYNQRSRQLLPRIVCIFDEYADFMAEKESRAALEQSIKRLGAMARAAGIHLIIATQRPEAGVVTPIIRSNLPGRVALRTASEADSAIILGGKQTDAARLLGKGDLLYLASSQLQRLQSLLAIDTRLL